MKEYFCSYMVFKGSAHFAYGDFVFESKVTRGNQLLGNIKEKIKSDHYSEIDDISVVLTSLSEINK